MYHCALAKKDKLAIAVCCSSVEDRTVIVAIARNLGISAHLTHTNMHALPPSRCDFAAVLFSHPRLSSLLYPSRTHVVAHMFARARARAHLITCAITMV